MVFIKKMGVLVVIVEVFGVVFVSILPFGILTHIRPSMENHICKFTPRSRYLFNFKYLILVFFHPSIVDITNTHFVKLINFINLY